MSFYNVLQGDAPYLKYLADNYAMSDNFHQAVEGGTGANHIMLGTGDAMWFSDGNGHPAKPPHNQLVGIGSKNEGIVDEIENPNAQAGTNNWYAEDGYGGGSYGSPSFGGGSYSNCSDSDQPGVASVLEYLSTLSRMRSIPSCAPGHYYLLNNYNPGYFGDGSNAYTDNNDANTVFTIPPSNVRNYRRRAAAERYFLEVLRRSVESLSGGQVLSESAECLLQHLQLLPVLDVDHDQTRRSVRRT